MYPFPKPRRSLFAFLWFANAAGLGRSFHVAVIPPSVTPLTKVEAFCPQKIQLRYAANGVEGVDSNESEGLELSPMQMRFLRKETGKRRARRKLHRFSLPDTESSGLFTDESVAAISGMLAKNELVEVRGISKGNKKNTFSVSEELALTLSYDMGKDVFVVDRSGFVAVMYCPGDDSLDGKIPLRTSIGKKNVWEKRLKAPRDNRGQIITEKKD